MGQKKRWVAAKVVTVEEVVSKELYENQVQDLTNALYEYFVKQQDELKEAA